MPKTKRFPPLVLWLTVVMLLAGPTMIVQAKPPLHLAIKRQISRNEFIKFEPIIESLNITSGMTILDVGSGPGYASFLLAEKLQGSGEVFATDIREDFVNYINQEAKRRGLNNLSSAVVKEVGLDDFYFKHRYDLVLMSNVYHCIDNRIEYFSKLRGLLKDNARLVLVIYNQTPLFSRADLLNADELINSLSKDTEDSPFIKYLSANTKQLIQNKTKTAEVESAVVDDFNRMLTDPQFYKNFYHDSYFQKDLFTPPEREFANWLLMSLKEDGALERPVAQVDAKSRRAVLKLNRLFFIKRFGKYLKKGGLGAYVPAGDANLQTSKYVMFRELDAAGYNFLKEVKLSPFFDAFIMVPKSP